MLRRTIFMALAILSGAITFVDDLGGAIVMGANKQPLVDAYEQAGVDVSDCNSRPAGVTDSSGGMPDCLEGTFKDIARKIEGAGVDDASLGGEGEGEAVGEPEIE
jgi:hypothetical protein